MLIAQFASIPLWPDGDCLAVPEIAVDDIRKYCDSTNNDWAKARQPTEQYCERISRNSAITHFNVPILTIPTPNLYGIYDCDNDNA